MRTYIHGTLEIVHAPFDGSGNFNRTFPPGGWQGDAAGAIKIRADRHDQHDADLAQGLSNALCRDGQSQVTADIPFNGKKLLNIGTPTAPTDAATKAYVDTAAAASVYAPPIGCGMDFWGGTAPPKWVIAVGQPLSRVTYSQLFTLFGTAYGAGDGSTTFNMPDVRGRVVACADALGGTPANRLTGWTLGVAGGAQGHNLTVAEMAPHSHGVSDPTHAHSVYDPTHAHGQPQYLGAWNGVNNDASGPGTKGSLSSAATSGAATGISINGASTGISINNTGNGDGHNNVQPTIAAYYIIYAGV